MPRENPDDAKPPQDIERLMVVVLSLLVVLTVALMLIRFGMSITAGKSEGFDLIRSVG